MAHAPLKQVADLKYNVNIPKNVKRKEFNEYLNNCGLFRDTSLNLLNDESITNYKLCLETSDIANVLKVNVKNWFDLGNLDIRCVGHGLRRILWNVIFGSTYSEQLREVYTNSHDNFRKTLRVFKAQTIGLAAGSTMKFFNYLLNYWNLGDYLESVAEESGCTLDLIAPERQVQFAIIFCLVQDRSVADAILKGFLSRVGITSRGAPAPANENASESEIEEDVMGEVKRSDSKSNFVFTTPEAIRQHMRHLTRAFQQAILLHCNSLSSDPDLCESDIMLSVQQLRESHMFREVTSVLNSLSEKYVIISILYMEFYVYESSM